MMHEFFFQLEEPSGTMALISRQDVPQRWIRAICSCGWRAADDARFTIEENVHFEWQRHRDSVALAELRSAVVAEVRLLTVPEGALLVMADPFDPYGDEEEQAWIAETMDDIAAVVGHNRFLLVFGDMQTIPPAEARRALQAIAERPDDEEGDDG